MVLEEKLAMRCRRFGRRVSVPNRDEIHVIFPSIALESLVFFAAFF